MVFDNLQDFINKVNPSITPDTRPNSPNISQISDLHSSIHKGCSCSRAQRIQIANNAYKNIGAVITPIEQVWLKSLFNNEEIVFKDNEQIFFNIP